MLAYLFVLAVGLVAGTVSGVIGGAPRRPMESYCVTFPTHD